MAREACPLCKGPVDTTMVMEGFEKIHMVHQICEARCGWSWAFKPTAHDKKRY